MKKNILLGVLLLLPSACEVLSRTSSPMIKINNTNVSLNGQKCFAELINPFTGHQIILRQEFKIGSSTMPFDTLVQHYLIQGYQIKRSNKKIKQGWAFEISNRNE